MAVSLKRHAGNFTCQGNDHYETTMQSFQSGDDQKSIQ